MMLSCDCGKPAVFIQTDDKKKWYTSCDGCHQEYDYSFNIPIDLERANIWIRHLGDKVWFTNSSRTSLLRIFSELFA